LRRDDESKRHYADNFEHVFGLPLERRLAGLDRFERQFQERNLRQVREQPITPHRALVATAVGSTSRAFYDDGVLYGAFDFPGVVAHIGALDTRSGGIRRIADLKGPMLYKVTSLAWDPATARCFYSNDNLALRDVLSVNVDTGKETLLLKDARSASWCSTAPTARSRRAARERDWRRSCASRIRTPTGSSAHLCVRRGALRPRHLARRSAAVRFRRRSERRAVPAPVAAGTHARRRCAAAARTQVRPIGAETFAFSPDGRYLYARATTRACRTSSDTKSPPARSKPCRTPSRGSSARCRSPTGS